MRAEKGFSNLVLVLVAALLLGSVAFIGILPTNLAAPPVSDKHARNTSLSTSPGGGGDAEYLIITRPMFENALENLVELKSQRMSVKVVTVEEITGEAMIYASADARVFSTRPDTPDEPGNLSVRWVWIGEDDIHYSFLKFSLSSLPSGATIISAKLHLFATYAAPDDSGHGETRYIDASEVSDDSWQESTITWNTKPSHGNMLDRVDVQVENTWYEWDVTSFVAGQYVGDKVVSLCMRPWDLRVDTFFVSKDLATDNRHPYLEINFSGGVYPGRDIPEQIRNCIRDHYENHGTKWVLLAGDADHDGSIWENDAWHINYELDKDWEVPPRYVSETPLPNDYYYAGLDGNWDNDGDNIFGELGEVDWEANVYVGRIPARDTSTMQIVIDKTVNYELNPPRKIKDIGFFAASHDGPFKHWIKMDIIPSEISVHELYESDDNLDYFSFVDAINNYNPVLVNAAGHGTPYGISLDEGGNFVDINTPNNLVNKGFLMFSLSCSTNRFDLSYNSLGEAMLFSPLGGAVGYVGFVGAIGGGEIDVAFFKEIFWNEEYHQGAIFYRANERASSLESLMCVLLGDPELKIVEPVSVSISPGHGSGLPGEEITYTVTVRNMSNREENYDLTATDNAGWQPTVSPNTLTVPADENRTATLSVIVPQSAIIRDEDKITVTATSVENPEANDSASCIAHAGLRVVIYPSAAVCAGGQSYDLYFRTQLKFDMGGIPSNANLASIKLWLYRDANPGSWDGRIRVNRVDDQTWNENIGADQFNAQLLTHQQDHQGKWMFNGWDYVNVANQLMPDYNGNKTYTSFRLRWTGDEGTQLATECYSDRLEIGSSYMGEGFISVSDPYLEIIMVPSFKFSLATLYEVSLDVNLYLNEGSKLVVKFYTYGDAFENENVIESFAPPWHVEENEIARHPNNIGVKKARLDLTTDNTEEVISTIASFIVRKVHLETRFMDIPFWWSQADAAGKVELETEFMEIPFYQSQAPS